MPSSPNDYFETEYGLTSAEAAQVARAIRERVKLDLAASRYIELDALPPPLAPKRRAQDLTRKL